MIPVKMEKLLSSGLKAKMDEGICWVVVVGSFLSQFTAFGFHNIFGQLYIELLAEFGRSKALTAWIGSSSFALAFLVGPLTGVACRRFGCSAISILGALLFGLGLFLSAYVDSIYKLYITYSLLIAVGSSCIYYSSILVLRDYFSRNFALVNGIALSGVGIGTIALAPVLDFLLVHFKWRVTLKIMSGMSVVFVFSGIIYYVVPKPSQPSAFDEKTGDKKLLDFSVFQNKAYLVWTVVVVLVTFGFYVPYVHLVRHCNDLKIPRSKGVVLVGYIALSQSLGRVCFGRLADHPRVNRVYLFQFSLLVCSVLTTLLPVMKTYSALLAYCWLYGISDGCFGVLLAVLTADIVGKNKFASGLGFLYCFAAFPLMLGPMVAGWIYDIYQTYNPSFFIAGALNVTGVCLVFLINSLLPVDVEEERSASLNRNLCNVHVYNSEISCDSDTKTSFFQSDFEVEIIKDAAPKNVIVKFSQSDNSDNFKKRIQRSSLVKSINNIPDKLMMSVPKQISQNDVFLPVNNSYPPLFTCIEGETAV